MFRKVKGKTVLGKFCCIFCILPYETSVKRKFAVHLMKNVTIAGNLTATVSTSLSQPAWASSAQDPLPPFTEVSFPRATSQADKLAYPFGDCRVSQMLCIWPLRSFGCLPESWRKSVVLHKQLFSCLAKISMWFSIFVFDYSWLFSEFQLILL